MWYNKYVGLPFKARGRSLTGLDCWGLARLVYKDVFSINLPSFDAEYTDVKATQEEFTAKYREYWEPVTDPKLGDLVLFRILGKVSHVGIYIGNGKFLHAKQGQLSAIERLDSTAWKHRVSGYVRYSTNKTGKVTALPSIVRTERHTVPVPEGTTVGGLSNWIKKEFDISDDAESNVVVLVNGKVAEDPSYVLKETDIVEYRNLPLGDALKFVAILVIAFYAPMLASALIGPTFGIGALQVLTAVTAFAINAVGMLLINAIFPPKVPKVNDPGVTENQLMAQGGSNQANKYGAIPVVLGKVRMTAPLGAQTYSETNDKDSYLKMLLVWGFGPLSVTDIRIGNNSIDQYQNANGSPVDVAHLGVYSTEDDTSAVQNFNAIYPADVQQNYVGVKLVNNAEEGNPWIESAFTQTNVTKLSTAIHFPQGLRAVNKKNGGVSATSCQLEVEYRKIPTSGDPGAWDPSTRINYPNKLGFTLDGYNYISNPERFKYSHHGSNSSDYNDYYYRWYTVGVRTDGTTFVKRGSLVEDPAQEPSQALIDRQKAQGYSYTQNVYFSRLPTVASNEIVLYDICLYGGYDTTRYVSTTRRTAEYNYFGFDIPTKDRTVHQKVVKSISSIDIGGISSIDRNISWNYDEDTTVPAVRKLVVNGGIISKTSVIHEFGINNYVKRKDAFTHNIDIPITDVSPDYSYQIRVRRLDADAQEAGDLMISSEAQLLTVTLITSGATPPITVDPSKFTVARTAIRIRATNQLNSQIEGINALVQTVCLDYGKMFKWVRSPDTGLSLPTYTNGWRMSTTSNPASLFRYVLEHPANARRVKSITTKINIAALEDWHRFCEENDYTYNTVISEQRSVMDVLRDIAAAGRASPAIVDGKWTVIIDRPRTDIVQHFTPHNSWGFEATKRLPRMPDGIKVVFNNEQRGYQEEEVIIYNEGKSASNSEVFEQIALPGVTNPTQVQVMARWHLAQARLRPEIYTLNTDLEYLVCSRGDRVKVMHDVTMWGLGSGRISEVVSSSVLKLDEPQYLEAFKLYTLRIRTDDGKSIECTLISVPTAGVYTEVSLSAPLAAGDQVSPGSLFLLGNINQEAEDLVILSIEPYGNYNAKITLNNYSPEIYDVNYMDSNFAIPDFDTSITVPPKQLADTLVQVPNITKIVSDETVTQKTASGDFNYAIYVAFTNPIDLPNNIDSVELSVDLASDSVENWQSTAAVKFLGSNSVRIYDVYEGESYTVRLRYVSKDGRTGPWTSPVVHAVVGKQNPPATVTGLAAGLGTAVGSVSITWTANSEVDIAGYEVRSSDSDWGSTTVAPRYKGIGTRFEIYGSLAWTAQTMYVKAFDILGNYSTTAAQVSYNVATPGQPTSIAISYPTSSSVSNMAILTWIEPSIADKFSIKSYKVVVDNGGVLTDYATTDTRLEIPVTWSSLVTISVYAIDVGNRTGSTPGILTVSKSAPVSPSTITKTAIAAGGIHLSWETPASGDVPIAGYEIRTAAAGAGTSGALYNGSANSVDITTLQGTSNTWYIWSYDTSGKYSVTPTTITFSTTAPNAVTGITHQFNTTSTTSSSVGISWAAAQAGMFDVDAYVVTLSYTTPSAATITSTRYTTDWEVPANWTGGATVTVVTKDITGRLSTAASYTIDKAVPNTPDAIIGSVFGTQLALDWPDTTKTTLPVTGYELRSSDAGWGSTGFVWKGSSSNATVPVTPTLGTKTWYLKAIDSDGKYSATARSFTYTLAAPVDPTGVYTEFTDTSLTAATVSLYWDNVTPIFGLKGYEVSYDGVSDTVDSTTITLPANWLGNKVFTIKTVDLLGNKSTGISVTATKLAPDPITGFRAQVIDNNVLLYWNLPNKTTLPISHALIKKGSTWAAATAIGEKDGTFTSISELVGGNYTYWIAAVDTDGAQSTPVSLGAVVSQPPDFVFNAEYSSLFTGTKVNAINVQSPTDIGIILPVSPTETFTTHFTSKGWDQPSDQIAAGYPVYIQPGVTSGYYEEVFDYGTLLGSSQITASYSGVNVSGTPNISVTISTSPDNVTYTDFVGTTNVFANNFRYIKVRVTVTQQTAGNVYQMDRLTVRLDAKQRSDSGMVAAVAGDALGTVVNYSTEFIDVTSITTTSQSTTPRTAVYDYIDTVRAGTYSVTSNVCTVTLTGHGFTIGQKLRLFFTTGAAAPGLYYVSAVPNANSFTVAISSANTSGNVSVYPNSMRVYLFDTAGTRVSGNVSWAIRGY